jgi:hypothetical protein
VLPPDPSVPPVLVPPEPVTPPVAPFWPPVLARLPPVLVEPPVAVEPPEADWPGSTVADPHPANAKAATVDHRTNGELDAGRVMEDLQPFGVVPPTGGLLLAMTPGSGSQR